MTATDNTAVVLRFFENFSAGNAEAAFALLDDQAVWRVMGKPDRYAQAGDYDKGGLVQLLTEVGQIMPNGVDIKVTSTTAQDDRVVLEAESHGVSAAGKVYDQRLIYVFQLRDGRILHVREYLDTQHANDVMTVTEQEPSAAGSPAVSDKAATELALRAVAVRCAAGLDRLDPDLMLSAYHPDGRLVVPSMDHVVEGHDELAETMKTQAGFDKRFHFIGNTSYEIADSGDTATGEIYVLAHHLTGEEVKVSVLRYQDRYSRRNGEWRIDERSIDVDWNHTHAAVPSVL